MFATAQLDGGQGSGLDDLLGGLLASRPAWHADALCQEHPEVDFFADRHGSPEPGQEGVWPVPGEGRVRRVGGRRGAPTLYGVWGAQRPGSGSWPGR